MDQPSESVVVLFLSCCFLWLQAGDRTSKAQAGAEADGCLDPTLGFVPSRQGASAVCQFQVKVAALGGTNPQTTNVRTPRNRAYF